MILEIFDILVCHHNGMHMEKNTNLVYRHGRFHQNTTNLFNILQIPSSVSRSAVIWICICICVVHIWTPHVASKPAKGASLAHNQNRKTPSHQKCPGCGGAIFRNIKSSYSLGIRPAPPARLRLRCLLGLEGRGCLFNVGLR